MEQSKIFEAYANAFWLEGKNPESIGAFCKASKIKPEDFRAHFESFDEIQLAFPKFILDQSIERLEADETFPEYTSREKALAFFFTLIEEFSKYKSYFKIQASNRNPLDQLKHWREFNLAFVENTNRLQTDDRITWVKNKLPNKLTKEMNGLLLAWNYVYRVWLADTTADNAKTDAAIEKTIHLYFDFANTDQFEKILDFGKFVVGTKVSW